MIDPNKIRLGNRLYIDWLGTQREIEVKGIFPDKIYFEDYWKEGETFCKPESLSGIPLTEKHLLADNYETADAETDLMQYEKDGFSIYNDGGLDGYSSHPFYIECTADYIKKEIKYVHELQNAYLEFTSKKSV